ncbi:MAG: choice-of-anchor D domain-containing protein [Sandaracinaceae bacterium]|nr:choice-of-anchor D domain-containing protein [Sandaracinaceae bacterium]
MIGLAAALGAAGCDGGSGEDAGTDGMVPGDGGPPGDAAFTITPALQNFGDLAVGASSSDAAFTVTNVGMSASGAITTAIGGAGAPSYSITANTCAGMTLAPAATCMISVRFSPTQIGSLTGTLTASAGTATASATLEGRGVEDAGLSISPTPFDFGPTAVGTPTAATTFTVRNTGDEPSGTISITLGGAHAAQFTLGADTCNGMTLAADASCTVEVTYSPSVPGSHAASLQATASPGSTATASLTGSAAQPATLRLTPGVQDFGTVVQGSTSSDVEFLLSNPGGVPTEIVAHTFGGTDASEFSIATSTCSGAPLLAGATCRIVVRFTAGAPGDKEATLDVTAGTLTATASLTATSVTIGNIAIDPTANDYGITPVGMQTGGVTYTVRNTGSSATGALAVAIAGSNPADFPIVSGGDGCSGTTLPGGGECTIAVRFAPVASGARSATLRVSGTPGGVATSALSGTGEVPAMFELRPTAADFGTVAAATMMPPGGESSPVNFTLRNVGEATSGAPTVTLRGADSTHFTIAANGCSAPLAAGAECTITLRFRPTSLGTKTARLEVVGAPGGTVVSDITGVGITPSVLSVNPTTHNFGNVARTSTPVAAHEHTFIVTNGGAEPVATLSQSITGAGASHFSIVAAGTTCAGSLAGMSSCNIRVRFTPTALGELSASLDVVGSTGGTVSSALTGTGIPSLDITPNTNGTFDFGTEIVDQPNSGGATQIFAVTNRTNRTISMIDFTSPEQGATATREFWRNAGCVGMSLMPGASCNVTGRFRPLGAAGPRMSTLAINGSGGASESIALTGTASGPMRFNNWQVTSPLEGSPVATFPATFNAMGAPARIVGTEYQLTLNLVNSGTGNSGVISTSANFTGDMNLVSDTCSGRNLASAATCAIIVRFYPQSASTSSGTVQIDYGMNSASVMVTGSAVVGPQIEVTGDTNFGTVRSTRSSERTFTVRNLSPTQPTLNLRISGLPTFPSAQRFSRSGGTCTFGAGTALMGGASCTIVARFDPIKSDVTDADLTQSFNVCQGADCAGGAVQTVTTNVRGRAQSNITLAPAPAGGTVFTTPAGTSSAPVQFTVTNEGLDTTAPLTISVFHATAATAAQFAISANTCGAVTAGNTCTFNVTYSPPLGGAVNVDDIQIRVSDGSSANFPDRARHAFALVDGRPITPATLVISPATATAAASRLWFGRVPTGANSETARFTVTNTGSVPSGALTTALAASTHFQIIASTCSGVLAGGAECTVDVRFSPTGTGTTDLTTELTVTAAGGASGGGTVTGFLRGTRLTSGSFFVVSPTPHDFGPSPIGTATALHAFTIFNGTADARVVSAPASVPGFTVLTTPATGDRCRGVSVGPGGSCVVRVEFNPATAGFQQQAITVPVATVDDAVIAVRGTGQTAASITVTQSASTPSNPFPNTVVGQRSVAQFSVQNTGDVTTATAPMVSLLGADPGSFAIASGNTCTTALAGGATCGFAIEFAPTSAGMRTATLRVNAGPGPQTVDRTVSGTGLAAALLGLSPSATQSCGTTNAASDTTVYACPTYTVSNNGGSPAELSHTVTGDFRATGGTCFVGGTPPAMVTLPNGGAPCTIIVSHAPPSVGMDSGMLTVSSPGVASVSGSFTATAVSAFRRTAPAPDAMGNVAFGSTSVTGTGALLTFVYENGASPATGIMTYTISGANAGDFQVQSDSCSGRSIAPAGTCSVEVRFLPGATGARTATLRVGDGTPEKTSNSTMTGTGT